MRRCVLLSSLLVACSSPREGTWEVTSLIRQPTSDDCTELASESLLAQSPLRALAVDVEVDEGFVYIQSSTCLVEKDGTFPSCEVGSHLVESWSHWKIEGRSRYSGVVLDPEELEFAVDVERTCDGEDCLGVTSCTERYEGTASWLEGPSSDGLDLGLDFNPMWAVGAASID